MEELNDNGILIATIIIYLVFFISIIIIINEIINITKFCYKYTYNYNYGSLNEKTCLNDDSTSIIEYEKSRYRIYNTINNYKLQNDLFNKNWINYIAYLSILLLSIIFCISFGLIFKHYFIDSNDSCINKIQPSEYSFLKLTVSCFFKDYDKFIPNCTMNYIIIFMLIIIYPLIFLFKALFKVDYTWNGGYWTRISHMIFFTILLFYAYILFGLKQEEGKQTEKITQLTVYLSYVIVFYIANVIFNHSIDEYNQPDKMSNIYDTDENKKYGSTDVSPNDKNDTTFFDIYKQTAPLKPLMPEILQIPPKDNNGDDLLTTFKYLSSEKLKKNAIICKCAESVKGIVAATTGVSDENKNLIFTNTIKLIYSLINNNLSSTVIKKKVKEAGAVLSASAVTYGAYITAYILYAYEREYNGIIHDTALANAKINYNSYFIFINSAAVEKTDVEKATATTAILTHYEQAKLNYRTSEFLSVYEENLNTVNSYYKAKKDYDNELEIYNKKYNNYKNSQIEFPKLIFVLYDILPKLIGLEKPIVKMIIITIIGYLIVYYILKNYNEKNSDYLYNTIFIYLIGIITIFVISNSVLTYNTYFNKYLIYEPTSQYKYDINNLNTIFNIALNNKNESIIQKQNFYKLTTNSKDIITIAGGGTDIDINTIIKTIKKNNTTPASPAIPTDEAILTAYIISSKTDINKQTAAIAIIRRAIYRALYSASIDLTLINTTISNVQIYTPTTADTVKYTPLYVSYTNCYNSGLNNYYGSTDTYPAIIAASSAVIANLKTSITIPYTDANSITTIIKTFFLMIRKTFLNDVSTINKRINTIKNNLKYSIYTDEEITKYIAVIDNDNKFYEIFLIKNNFSKEKIDKIDVTITNEIIKQYKKNIIAIDEILKYYAEYTLEFRKIVIALFNTVGYCDGSSVVNIDQRLNDYYNKVFIKHNDKYLAFSFKSNVDEPLIDVYKKQLLEKMKEANNLFVKYFNIIKFLVRYTITNNAVDTNQSNIIEEIKNNYNVFNKDNDKYIDTDLIDYQFKVQCNYTNRYNNFSLKDKTEQDININNVSWSFIILIIIFAVILIEPTII